MVISINKVKLKDIAELYSGVYLKGSPTGKIACLQVKDLLMSSPETTATYIEYIPKLENYLLKKGDLLFAGKGTTYLCVVFDFNFPAVPSTTLFPNVMVSSEVVFVPISFPIIG